MRSSDLNDKQWELIKNFFPSGNKSKYEKRELVNAVLYLVKIDCQWRNFPSDFPKWKAVQMFYYRACKAGTWEKAQQELVKKTRKNAGKTEKPSYGLIDSQSVKTVYASEKRGFDGEKNKRTKATHSNGYAWLFARDSRPATNEHDTKSGVYAFEKDLYRYPTIIGRRADQGYRGTFVNTFSWFHNIKIDISPRIKNPFEVQPIRWIVERTFGWMTWSRRLSKDFEIKTFYQEQMCIISNLHTFLKRF